MARKLDSYLIALFSMSLSLLLSGCTLDTTASPQAQPGVAIQGQVYGGRQAVTGAHVYLLAATTTGYGGSGIAPSALNASGSLLKSASTGLSDSIGAYVLSDNNGGNFSITGDYTCPVNNPQVYLYAVGGNSGSGENPAAAFVTALGPCNSLSSSTFVYMDEIVTVASAYALAGFASDATHIGDSAAILAKTGITNAFATVGNLVNIASGLAYAATPQGHGTVPQQELNALANSIAACVNTNVSNGSTQCATLFQNATNDGVTCTSAPCADEPSDTASAAINIAHFPSKNVAAIFGLAAGIGAPYQTPLSSAPANWTMSISFTGGGMTGMYTQANGMDIDASGNLWIASGAGTVLSEFNSLGVPANASGFTGLSLDLPIAVAVDVNSTHVWIANYNANNLIDFSIAGSSGVGHSVGAGAGPGNVAIDASGNAWATNLNASNVVKMTSGGTILNTITGNGVDIPGPIAFEPGIAGNVWIGDAEGAFNASLFTSAGLPVTAVASPGGLDQPIGAAIDASGNVWFDSAFANGVTKLNSTGTTGTLTALNTTAGADENAIAIDGAGNVWITVSDYDSMTASDNTVFELNSSGVNISGTHGYAALPSILPDAMAIDGSGNVWYTSEASQTDPTPVAGVLHELVGAAAPATTPLSYAVANSMLGTRP